MQNVLMIFLVLSLTGCGTAWVNRSHDPKGGTIRYMDDSLSSTMTEMHREKALSQIEKYCEGKYKLISEGRTTASGDYYSDDGRWIYFNFNCR